MIKRIIFLLVSIALLLFFGKWVLYKDAKWESILATVGSLVTVLVAIWGAIEKWKSAPKQTPPNSSTSISAPGIAFSGTFKATTAVTDQARSEEAPYALTVRDIREQLLLTDDEFRLKSLLAHAKKLKEENASPELDELIYALERAIQYKKESTGYRMYREYHTQANTAPYPMVTSSSKSLNTKSLLKSTGSFVILIGICYVVYRVIRYFVINW